MKESPPPRSKRATRNFANPRSLYMRAIRGRLLRKLVGLYESQKQFECSANAARKIVAADEFDEAARRDLMRQFALGGNSRQAVKQFEICRSVLQKELGVKPERETLDLFEQIVSGKFPPPDIQTKISGAEDAKKTFVNQQKTNLPQRLTSFIGREREIGEIKTRRKSGAKIRRKKHIFSPLITNTFCIWQIAPKANFLPSNSASGSRVWKTKLIICAPRSIGVRAKTPPDF